MAGEPGGGFTARASHLAAQADPAACNVADQEGDPDSVLDFCRRAIAARAAATTSPSALPLAGLARGTWAFARGEGTIVLINLSDAGGGVRRRARARWSWRPGARWEGTGIEGDLVLPAWSGAVVAR